MKTQCQIDQRVETLMANMSLKEKIGQLNQKMYGWQAYRRTTNGYELTDTFKEHVEKFDGMGALYGLFRADPWSGVDFSSGISKADSALVANMIQEYVQRNTRLGIPVLLSEEAPHGHQALDSTLMPTNIGAGATWNPALQEAASACVAKELRARGVHLGLVSTLDMMRDPRWGRAEECFSEDPYLAAKMTESVVRGMQGSSEQLNVVPVLKHFAAQGSGEGGHNSGAASIGARELREIHLPPMKAGVEAGALACMAAYNEIDGVPCHMNRTLLTDILRKEWAFTGVVMADGQALDRLLRLTDDKALAAQYSLNAGVDLSLWDDIYWSLETAVQEGIVSETLIDTAVKRVLHLKFKLGLFDNQRYHETPDVETVSEEPKNKAISLEVARQSIVLLKNESILPLSKQVKKIAVIGPNADHLYNMLGDYTPPQRSESGITIVDGIRSLADPDAEVLYTQGCGIRDTSTADFSKAKEIAQAADVVIVALGGSSTRDFGMSFEENGALAPYQETDMDCGENVDIADLSLGGVQDELVQAITETGTPIIAVLVQGRPHAIPTIATSCQAVLSAWYPGPQGGQAIAEVLFGDVNPSGKLPVTMPRSSMQLPVYYNYKDSGGQTDYHDMSGKPLYPFGYGLSYTTFNYRFANQDAKTTTLKALRESQDVQLNVEVTNTGARAGYEVIQLYITHMQASVTQRVLELKAFKKLWLEAGETQSVTLTLDYEALAIWDLNMDFQVEPGRIKLQIGGSSDTLLEKDLWIVETP